MDDEGRLFNWRGEPLPAAALRMIALWRRGCGCSGRQPQASSCPECAAALVDRLEQLLRHGVVATPEPPPGSLALSLEPHDPGACGDAPPDWCCAFTNEPTRSGTYLVRLSRDERAPTFELRFDVAPGGGMWRSGEQPPNDFVVLPLVAQWRPL